MDPLKQKLSAQHGGLVLDIATGRGDFITYLRDGFRGFDRAIGIDKCKNCLTKARLNVPDTRVDFVRADACRLGFGDNSFDTVAISNSLHHMSDVAQTLSEMKRVLKPGGLFIIYEMFCDDLTETQLSHLYVHLWWAEIDRLLGGVHNEMFTRDEIMTVTQNLKLSGLSFADDPHFEEGLVDDAKLNELAGTIDAYLERIKEHAEYDRLAKRGEELKRRLNEIGFAWSTHLAVVGWK
jgi:ubiquinone/menaquinone biosynthesis C-methylase UbiE